MNLYNVALFAHILGAVVLVGSGFVVPLIIGGAMRASTLSSFRDWAGVITKISKTAGACAAIVFVSGLYMGITSYSFAQGWLAVSLVLFVINGVLAGGLLDKHWKGVIAQAEAAGDGPVPADLRALAVTPRTHVIEMVSMTNDLVIVFLMTNKPGWVGALTAVAVGAVGAGALSARRTRHGQVTAAPAS